MVEFPNIEHYKGDTFKQIPMVYKLNGTPQNLTGAVIRMQLRKEKDGVSYLELTSVASAGITITDAANGSFKINTQSHIAIGSIFLLINGKTFGSNVSAALPFVVYTYGNSEGNLSAGTGWAYAGNGFGWAPKPTGYFAGMKRIARNWIFQGEGYFLSNNTDNTIYIATFRNIRPTSSWDFGFMRLQNSTSVGALPIIGYTLKF